jgi:hypothetical protein
MPRPTTTTPPPPPPPLSDLAGVIQAYWETFKDFQTAETDPGIEPLKQRIRDFIAADDEADGEVGISLFGAGFTAGVQTVLHALTHVAEATEILERIKDLPDKKIPRA